MMPTDRHMCPKLGNRRSWRINVSVNRPEQGGIENLDKNLPIPSDFSAQAIFYGVTFCTMLGSLRPVHGITTNKNKRP